MGEWLDTTIGDQVLLQRGIDITRNQQRIGVVPVISSGGISSFHDTPATKGPGVVLGRKGVVGSVWYVETDYWPHDTTLWVRDFKGNYPRFVYYFFKHRSSELARLDVGSANPTLNRNHVHPTPVRWPPVLQQRAIARILGALDDKIELNRKMNATLEAMARALFKSWFVDFDPVREKSQGRAPSGMDAETAKLFPSEFVESELGPIPKGWRVTSIGELLSLKYGKALRESNRQPGNVLVFGSNGMVGRHSEALVRGSGIVVGRKGNPGIVTWASSDFFVIDTAFYVVPKDVTMSLRFLRHLLETLDLARLSADSAVPGVNRNAIYPQVVIRPSVEVLARFHDHAEMWGGAAANLNEQSHTLDRLRDTLLPRLLSGELSVRAVERSVPEFA